MQTRGENPLVSMILVFQDGAEMRWRLSEPWDQVEMFSWLGETGAKFGKGITFDLPVELRTLDDLQQAHDALLEQILQATKKWQRSKEGRLAIAALDVLCWVLKHNHRGNLFQDNLERLGWMKMAKGDEPMEQ